MAQGTVKWFNPEKVHTMSVVGLTLEVGFGRSQSSLLRQIAGESVAHHLPLRRARAHCDRAPLFARRPEKASSSTASVSERQAKIHHAAPQEPASFVNLQASAQAKAAGCRQGQTGC